MKLAAHTLATSEGHAEEQRCRKLTVRGRIHDDEACVDLGLVFTVGPIHRVGMTAEAIGSLVHVNIMMGAIQGPQGSYTGATAAYDGHLLPRMNINRGCPAHLGLMA